MGEGHISTGSHTAMSDASGNIRETEEDWLSEQQEKVKPLKCLIVNAYPTNATGSTQFREFDSCIREAFTEHCSVPVEFEIRGRSDLGDILPDNIPDTIFTDEGELWGGLAFHPSVLFDQMDFVFIGGDACETVPWQQNCGLLVLLVKLCINAEKPVFYTEFGALLLAYVLSTGGINVHISNGSYGSQLSDLQAMSEDLPPGEEAYFMDQTTGDLFRREKGKLQWDPWLNVGLQVNPNYPPPGRSVPYDEIPCYKTNGKEDHWSYCNITEDTYRISVRRSWDFNANSLNRLQVVSESDRGPESLEHGHHFATFYRITKQSARSVRTLQNFILDKLRIMSDIGGRIQQKSSRDCIRAVAPPPKSKPVMSKDLKENPVPQWTSASKRNLTKLRLDHLPPSRPFTPREETPRVSRPPSQQQQHHPQRPLSASRSSTPTSMSSGGCATYRPRQGSNTPRSWREIHEQQRPMSSRSYSSRTSHGRSEPPSIAMTEDEEIKATLTSSRRKYFQQLAAGKGKGIGERTEVYKKVSEQQRRSKTMTFGGRSLTAKPYLIGSAKGKTLTVNTVTPKKNQIRQYLHPEYTPMDPSQAHVLPKTTKGDDDEDDGQDNTATTTASKRTTRAHGDEGQSGRSSASSSERSNLTEATSLFEPDPPNYVRVKVFKPQRQMYNAYGRYEKYLRTATHPVYVGVRDTGYVTQATRDKEEFEKSKAKWLSDKSFFVDSGKADLSKKYFRDMVDANVVSASGPYQRQPHYYEKEDASRWVKGPWLAPGK